MNTQLPIRTASPHLNEIRAERGFHWWYPAIIDAMISHPEWSMKQIAESLGVSYSTIYLVTSCDLFRAHLAKRREEISRAHDAAIGERLARVATVALDKILEHVESKPGASMALPQLTELGDKVLSRLGYGEKKGPISPVQVNVNNAPVTNTTAQTIQVSANDLIEARQALRAAEMNRALLEPPESRSDGVARITSSPQVEPRLALPVLDLVPVPSAPGEASDRRDALHHGDSEGTQVESSGASHEVNLEDL